MVLDHNRLGLEKLILGKQIRPNFFMFDKFNLQNLANKSGWRVSMGLTDSRKTAKNLADSRKT